MLRGEPNCAPDSGGPQSLAGPPALLVSAGRSGLLRCATARPPRAAGRLDFGDGHWSQRPIIRGLGRSQTARAHDQDACSLDVR